jgi:hypothetical protein
VVLADPPTGIVGECQEPLEVGGAQRDRLLADHVGTGGEAQLGQRDVGRRRCEHVHDLGPRSGEHLIDGRVGGGAVGGGRMGDGDR